VTEDAVPFAGAATFGVFFSGGFAARTGFAGLEDFAAEAFTEVGRTLAPFVAATAGFLTGALARLPGLATFFGAVALLFGAGFRAAAFFAGDFAAALPPAADFAGLDTGRLGRDTGLFGALLRGELLPGFFPFTLAISQPFRNPWKNELRNIAAVPLFRQPFRRTLPERCHQGDTAEDNQSFIRSGAVEALSPTDRPASSRAASHPDERDRRGVPPAPAAEAGAPLGRASANLFGESLPEPLGDGLDLLAVRPLHHDTDEVLGSGVANQDSPPS
jgi:hypothetical protein